MDGEQGRELHAQSGVLLGKVAWGGWDSGKVNRTRIVHKPWRLLFLPPNKVDRVSDHPPVAWRPVLG